MRKGILYGSGLLILLFSLFSAGACSDKKTIKEDSVTIDTGKTDSTSADTLETLLSEQPMPKAADELFDDFFFNFSANKKLQRKRISFPLPVYESGKVVKTITKSDWKIDNFFMRQDFYTLIFDNVKQMKVVKDTTINHVVVEKIYFKNKSVKQYLFNRIHGEWKLTSLNIHPMGQNSNASFLHFYQRFTTDSAFQMRSIHDPLYFVGPDPDNDFSNTSGTLLPEQWPSFAPELPHALIYNIIYGQKYTESNQKIFVIRGIANGLETELTFKRLGKTWKLMKLSM
jgi:putative lipoprotein